MSFYETPPGSLDIEERPTTFTKRASVASSSSPKLELSSRSEDAKVQCVWKPGVYSLINAGSGTVIDLSGADNTSIIGFPAHHGPNQQVCIFVKRSNSMY